MFTHLPTLQDVSELTEEEQLALALQMSMQQGDMEAELQPMDTDTTPAVAQSTEVRVRWQLTPTYVILHMWYTFSCTNSQCKATYRTSFT